VVLSLPRLQEHCKLGYMLSLPMKTRERCARDVPGFSCRDLQRDMTGVARAYAVCWYCRPRNFCRSEQEHKGKGDETKSAKYGLRAYKDQVKLHLRPMVWKHLTENHTAIELIMGWVPWLPGYLHRDSFREGCTG